jgi:hypothetical protein
VIRCAVARLAHQEYPVQVRIAFAALAGLIVVSATPAALAQSPADLAKFSESCLAAQTFLLGDVPEGVDSSAILTPLCGCLGTAFKDLPQKDVDMLAADLRGEGTDEAHAAHGDYEKLTEQAREGLNTCFADPEVAAALQAAQPAATEPAPADPAATPQ